MTESPRYQSYLIRLWQVSEGGRPALRISLENTHSRERRGFTDLDDLLSFLRNALQTSKPREETPKATL
jgi:hypothetical protein